MSLSLYNNSRDYILLDPAISDLKVSTLHIWQRLYSIRHSIHNTFIRLYISSRDYILLDILTRLIHVHSTYLVEIIFYQTITLCKLHNVRTICNKILYMTAQKLCNLFQIRQHLQKLKLRFAFQCYIRFLLPICTNLLCL